MKFLHYLVFLLLFCTLKGYGNSVTIFPKNSTTLQNGNVQFHWNRIDAALRYRIIISTNISLSPIYYIDSTILTTQTVINLSHNSYYWQISVDTGLGFNYNSHINQLTIVNPLSYDSLLFWIKPESVVSGMNDTVISWNDVSGRNYNLSQTTSSRRPIINRNAINGFSVPRFDGVNDLMTAGNVDLHVNRQHTFFSIQNIEDINIQRALVAKGSLQGSFYLRKTTANKLSSIIDAETKTGTSTITPSRYHMINYNIGIDSCIMNLNRIQDIRYIPTADLLGTNSANFEVGGFIAAAEYWKGNICEMLIYRKSLSINEKNNIENYLMDKYAPPANIGSDIVACMRDSVVISAWKKNSYISYLWNTGSTDSAIKVISTGFYSVRLIDIFNRVSYDTLFAYVDTTNTTIRNISDTTLCVGSNLQIVAGDPHYNYSWSTGDTTNNINIVLPGTYFVTMNNCRDVLSTDTFTVVSQNISFNLGNDTTCLEEDTIQLRSILGINTTYLWNTGATSISIKVFNPGLYWCLANDTVTGCYFSDTIVINKLYYDPCYTVCPVDNINVYSGIIQFNWNTINNARRYKFTLFTDSLLTYTYTVDSTITSPSYTININNGRYYWQVVTDTGAGFNLFSCVKQLTIVDPLSYDSLLFWIKPESVVSGMNDTVISWNDVSGRNYNLSQTTSSRRPIINRNAINGFSVPRFDGVNDLMTAGNVDLHVNRQHTFFSIQNIEDINIQRALVAKGSLQGSFYLRKTTANKLSSIIDAETKTGTSTITPSRYHMINYNIGIDSCIMNLNRIQDIRYIPTADLLGTNSTNFEVGGFIAAAEYWKGNICEMLIYRKSLSINEKNNIENYLMDKYAPPVCLGPDITKCIGDKVLLDAYKNNSYISYQWSNGSIDSAIQVNRTGKYSIVVTDIFGRTSTDTINVIIDSRAATPLLINDTSVCLGSPLFLSAGPSHYSYTWSNGDTNSTTTITTGGTYWVQRTDCQNIIQQDTFVLSEVDIRFNLGSDTILCLFDTLTLIPTTIRPVSYLWNTGATTSSLPVSNQQNYWCRLRDNALGCYVYDTISISIDSFPVIVKLGNDTSLCSGNSITLLEGISLLTSILWNTGDTTLTTVVNTDGNYYYTAHDTLGCISKDTIHVRIKGLAPYVEFIANNICSGDTLRPINLSGTLPPDAINRFDWYFGDMTTDTAVSPVHLYDTTGLYTIYLNATTDSGCSNFYSQTISYSDKPIARITSLIACANSNVVLNDASISPTGFPINNWLWNVNGVISTNPNFPYNFPLSGKYPIQLRVTTSGGCSDTYIDSFEVFPEFNIDFTNMGNCIGDTTRFTDVSGSFSIIQREWIFGTSLGYAFNTATPKFYFPSPGNYPVSYKAKNALGCIDSIYSYIQIYSKPNAYFIDSMSCLNAISTFSDFSISSDDTINYWQWRIDTSTYTTRNANHISNTVLPYTALLVVQTIHGCKDTFSRNVTVSSPPTASFTYTPNYGVAPLPVSFTNTSIGATSYVWYFNDASNTTSTQTSPTFTYTVNNIYIPTLIAINANGCIDSAREVISINPSELDIQVSNIRLNENVSISGISNIGTTIRLSNVGSRAITNARIKLQAENGSIFIEDWSGLLLPGQFTDFTFTSKLQVSTSAICRYVCVEAIEVNDGTETNLVNNSACKNLNSQGASSNIYPNPASNQITLDVVLQDESEIIVSLHNEQGSVIYLSQKIDGQEGLNRLIFDLNKLSNGHYYISIQYFNTIEKKKFEVIK